MMMVSVVGLTAHLPHSAAVGKLDELDGSSTLAAHVCVLCLQSGSQASALSSLAILPDYIRAQTRLPKWRGVDCHSHAPINGQNHRQMVKRGMVFTAGIFFIRFHGWHNDFGALWHGLPEYRVPHRFLVENTL